MGLRLVFMGAPAFAATVLDRLLKSDHQVIAVYSQPPRPGGRRGLSEVKTPVHEMADANGLPVFTPLNFKETADIERFAAHDADVAVVVAYGLLLPQPILDAPSLGCLNVHASKLPRWRGAAPIHRAIMAGDTETAVGIMQMEKGLDTGPLLAEQAIAIDPLETTGDLHDRLADAGAELMTQTLDRLAVYPIEAEAQQGDSSYAAKIDKAESRIDWNHAADQVHNHIRGLSPFPGAWFEMDAGGKPVRVKVLRSAPAQGRGAPGEVLNSEMTIACQTGAVKLLQLQRAGGKPMAAEDFWRGAGLVAGDRLD